jgi:hypothetical protein
MGDSVQYYVRWLFLIVSAVTALAAPVSSQSVQPAQAPGAASIVLVPRLVPGEVSTLAVLDAGGRLVSGAIIEFPGEERVTTDATGRATFVAPLTPGVLMVHLSQRSATASSTVLAPQPLPAAGLQVTDYPRVISITDRFPIEGFGFAGRADANRVTLGDRAAAVLAASPVALVVLPAPASGIGSVPLQIEAAGKSTGPLRVTLVLLRVQGPSYQLSQGQQDKLTVHVRGSQEHLAIEARNLSPKVVDFPGGNVQRVVSRGGADNFAEIEFTGLTAGDYLVSVRLVPGAAGLPDMAAVREKLGAAEKIAKGDWRDRIARLIRRIERDPQDVSHVRDELERMLAQNPETELAKQLQSAWQLLLKP